MYKIDGSELYEYQQQLLQPPEDIPIWEKKMSYGRGSGCLFRYWRAKIKGTIDG